MRSGTVFYLMRHGEARQNVLGILDSFPGNPVFGLTDFGKRQAEFMAGEIVRLGADLLFASPMRRTRETAGFVAKACGLSVRYDDRLREIGFGSWNGTPAEAFLGPRGKYHDPLLRIDGNVEEGLESARDMRARLVEFLADTLSEHEGSRIAIVSHGDPLEQLHGILVGDDIVVTMTGWYPRKGEVTEVSVPPGFRETMLAREPLLSSANPS
ncbi:MAG: histidine phosphatase family protein [Candidatus Moranbacteria bacterium]|nr:histidine phosphatase family protein [Candidatus Moranbacteria bacterium]